MTSECLAIAERLLRETGSCLGRGARTKLYRASLKACREYEGGEELVPVLVDGVVVYIPLSQLPEAWANILHVYCYHDYDRDPRFTPGTGWIVLDVGGFLGFYTLYAAKRVGPSGRVVVVEPNPLAREHLYRNISANRLAKRVVIDPRAVAGHEGIGTLYVGCYWANTSLVESYVEEGPGTCGRIHVATVTLEKLVDEHGLDRIDLVKIDVEGMEYAVLQGAASLLAEGRLKRIVVEVHEAHAEIRDIVGLLEAYGYSVWFYGLGEDYGQSLIYAILQDN